MTSQSSTPIPILFAYLFTYNSHLNMLDILVSFIYIYIYKSPLPFKDWKLKISLIA